MAGAGRRSGGASAVRSGMGMARGPKHSVQTKVQDMSGDQPMGAPPRSAKLSGAGTKAGIAVPLRRGALPRGPGGSAVGKVRRARLPQK